VFPKHLARGCIKGHDPFTFVDAFAIVIDDVKVPGRPDIGYDAYGPKECSFEYVKDKIDKIFTRYSIEYLIPSNIKQRAKLVILPL
jgi:hypothetical protein